MRDGRARRTTAKQVSNSNLLILDVIDAVTTRLLWLLKLPKEKQDQINKKNFRTIVQSGRGYIGKGLSSKGAYQFEVFRC